MILYKYLDLATGQKMIKNSTVRFTTPNLLNDPFETSCRLYESGERKYNDTENIIRNISVSDCYGILSLSRSATNPLMWAHYSKGNKRKYKRAILLTQNNDAHGGMVIGIDTVAAGLDGDDNVVPAKFGNVIYTATKPIGPFGESENLELFEGRVNWYRPELLEALQRTFLYKSTVWSYEEEVRVVRRVKVGEMIQVINPNSIREVYIGSGHNHDIGFLRLQKKKILLAHPDCEIFVCTIGEKDWNVNAKPIDEFLEKSVRR